MTAKQQASSESDVSIGSHYTSPKQVPFNKQLEVALHRSLWAQLMEK